MTGYIAGRLGQAVITLLAVVIIVFFLARSSGDPALLMLPPTATDEEIIQMRRVLGTDRPLPVQFGSFVKRAASGDFGKSIRLGRPVMDLLWERLPNSVKLASLAMGVAVAIALVLGILAAVWRDSPVDIAVRMLGIVGQSMPGFWLGIVLIEVFAVQIRFFPVAGTGSIRHYILPATVIGWVAVAAMMRLLRAQMIEVLASDYVRTARAKGLSPARVVLVHALRNSLIPMMTYAGVHFGVLLGGAISVETVFAWPGLGQLGYQAVLFRDYPLIQGVTLFVGAMIVAANLLVDLMYGIVDPRIAVTR